MAEKVRLVEIDGKTRTRIDVGITDDGHLVFSGPWGQVLQ